MIELSRRLQAANMTDADIAAYKKAIEDLEAKYKKESRTWTKLIKFIRSGHAQHWQLGRPQEGSRICSSQSKQKRGDPNAAQPSPILAELDGIEISHIDLNPGG